MPSVINDAFMRLSKRAETNDRAKLVATFVDVGPLFTLLTTKDHQILYGRRGTGKTHAFSYLAENKQNDGHPTIFIDMRTIGSTGGLYSDTGYSVSQRATRLLLDTFEAIHEGLLSFFVKHDELYDLSITGPMLDKLADAITQVEVVGNIEREQASKSTDDASSGSSTELNIGQEGASAKFTASNEAKSQRQIEQRVKEIGTIEQRVHFGPLGKVLNELSAIVNPKRIWILLDEWSNIPIDLQPYLADLLRKSVFPSPNFTLKIAAIEQRSRFRIFPNNTDYIGFELGADIAADLNLDDFMVFDNNAERAVEFFQELLFRHYTETEDVDLSFGPQTKEDLIKEGFTQRSAFEEFVRATEGVPRDAINIITGAAQRAINDKISINHLRTAARNWYQRDKEAAAKSSSEAHTLLHWIIDEVIGNRRARAFLLRNDKIPVLIDALFDARVLHVLKRSVSSRHQPGIRYDVYKLDYGCYVDLVSTIRAPLGLLIADDEDGHVAYIDVPPDDYRAIRRAILEIADFHDRKIDPQLPLGM